MKRFISLVVVFAISVALVACGQEVAASVMPNVAIGGATSAVTPVEPIIEKSAEELQLEFWGGVPGEVIDYFAIPYSDRSVQIGDTGAHLFDILGEYDLVEQKWFEYGATLEEWQEVDEYTTIPEGGCVFNHLVSKNADNVDYFVFMYNPLNTSVNITDCHIGTILLNQSNPFKDGFVQDLSFEDWDSLLGNWYVTDFNEQGTTFYSWDLDPYVITVSFDNDTYGPVCVQHKDNPQAVFEMTQEFIMLMRSVE